MKVPFNLKCKNEMNFFFKTMHIQNAKQSINIEQNYREKNHYTFTTKEKKTYIFFCVLVPQINMK